MVKKDGKLNASSTLDSTIRNYSIKLNGRITHPMTLGILPLTSLMHLKSLRLSIANIHRSHELNHTIFEQEFKPRRGGG